MKDINLSNTKMPDRNITSKANDNITREFFEKEASFEQWLEWYNNIEKEEYEHPDIATDAVIVRFDPKNQRVKILLTNRTIHPFKDSWTLPGTFLHADEQNIETSIARMFKEKLNSELPKDAVLDQLRTYSNKDRDPRGQIVSVVHMIYTNQDIPESDTVKWFDIDVLEYYDTVYRGFDHYQIILDAIERMRSQFNWTSYLLNSLPKEFTLGNVVHLKASLFNMNHKKINRANLRKSMLTRMEQTSIKDNVTQYKVIENGGF